ncbi:23768_t:CDS:2 [Entrophospora sp. SA101]|nr:13396_t:CDS:2 [Entrophospora candida]CAH1757809.1 3609_t:CDS:2 [Entrophospora sp. SA101]CAJ0640558.1 1646_t:CDS:2 [Entrophospora sp. SA101]CAJ0753585.1 23768_t:CDS:2 [Entrophospora sp. SA101]CAJ0852885.1 12089_t:CDS:2 [Entrophospora sp. SA101]
METIDANEYLIQFLGSIDNLPSEINYHFTELSNKEREIDDLTRRIERRKKRLWCLYDGVPFEEDIITEFEDEEMLKEKISKDLDRIALLQDEKIEISGKALALVERHIKRLDEDFDSLFPHQNLRDSSTTIPTSPGRLESPIKSLQIITQHANINILYPSTSMETEEGQFSM